MFPRKIILAAVLTLGPCAAQAATVMQSIFQDSGESAINFTFINDDIGATYNSATLDLAAALGPVVDAIVLHNPTFATSADVYANMDLNITPTGDVSGGWSANINTTTGLVSITNNGFSYDFWTSATNQNTLTATLNLRNMLDFNGNGIIDPNETLAPIGTATNAFNAKFGATGNIFADVAQLGVIPEPGSVAVAGLAALALALRRRRTLPLDR